MPKTDDEWILDDTKDFTDEQLNEIKNLLLSGKQKEAKEIIDKILSGKSEGR